MLGLTSALWGIAHHLKDGGPALVCTEHRCECVGSGRGAAGNALSRGRRILQPW